MPPAGCSIACSCIFGGTPGVRNREKDQGSCSWLRHRNAAVQPDSRSETKRRTVPQPFWYPTRPHATQGTSALEGPHIPGRRDSGKPRQGPIQVALATGPCRGLPEFWGEEPRRRTPLPGCRQGSLPQPGKIGLLPGRAPELPRVAPAPLRGPNQR